MPYESFQRLHSFRVHGVVQNHHKGALDYIIQVKCKIRRVDDMFSPAPMKNYHDDTQAFPHHEINSVKTEKTRNITICNVYTIYRTFHELELLHRAVKSVMYGTLPPLPHENTLRKFFWGESPQAIERKQTAIEKILDTIEQNPSASHSRAYLDFVSNTAEDRQYDLKQVTTKQHDIQPRDRSKYKGNSKSLLSEADFLDWTDYGLSRRSIG
uniref:AlNc14C197G8586 protein n=1 Tax=Albugo laibachii Nc14 TaxID=890382 RepID=F0WQA5_9STRA|nr:AlNc14C197G8586 [Albugo laibachii Nc14]|eukprot:CCA23513.1 AlNc14C197G8586 [Albugo laibachii Nc14]